MRSMGYEKGVRAVDGRALLRYVAALLLALAVFLSVQLLARATEEDVVGGTATVNTDNVNVRTTAETGDSIGKASRGQTFTILGSTTDSTGKVWYEISGTIGGSERTGYIRYDFVDVTPPEPSDASSEGADGGSEEGATEAETTGGSDSTTSVGKSGMESLTALEPETEPTVIPEGFREVSIRVGGTTEVKAWTNDVFYILYGSESGGDLGWYLYDSVSKHYVRYVDFLLTAGTGSAESEGSGAKGINIFLLVLVIVFGVACVVLGFKVFGGRGDDDDYYDDDEDEEDEEEYRPRRNVNRDVRTSDRAMDADRASRSAQSARPQGGERRPASAQGERPARSAQGERQPQRSQGGERRPASGQGERPVRQGADRPVRSANGQGSGVQGGARQPQRRQGGGQQVRQSRPVEDDFDDYDDED